MFTCVTIVIDSLFFWEEENVPLGWKHYRIFLGKANVRPFFLRVSLADVGKCFLDIALIFKFEISKNALYSAAIR